MGTSSHGRCLPSRSVTRYFGFIVLRYCFLRLTSQPLNMARTCLSSVRVNCCRNFVRHTPLTCRCRSLKPIFFRASSATPILAWSVGSTLPLSFCFATVFCSYANREAAEHGSMRTAPDWLQEPPRHSLFLYLEGPLICSLSTTIIAYPKSRHKYL